MVIITTPGAKALAALDKVSRDLVLSQRFAFTFTDGKQYGERMAGLGLPPGVLPAMAFNTKDGHLYPFPIGEGEESRVIRPYMAIMDRISCLYPFPIAEGLSLKGAFVATLINPNSRHFTRRFNPNSRHFPCRFNPNSRHFPRHLHLFPTGMDPNRVIRPYMAIIDTFRQAWTLIGLYVHIWQ
jgi:hypothetical protein